MHARTAAILAGVWSLASAVAAQTTSADADRMERTRREAENPLRFIIESAQIKRGAKPADTPPPAVAPSRAQTERRAAASPRAPAPSAPPPSTPSAAPAETEVATIAPAPAAVMPENIAPAAPEPEPAAVVARLEPPPSLTAEPAKLELLNRVDPDVPARVRAKLKKSSEVTVDLKVQTDGSVTDVAVQETSNALLNDPVVAAVSQWRFAPLPQARTHRIVVVYKVAD